MLPLETTILKLSWLHFRGKNGYANALQCYIIRTLPMLLLLRSLASVKALLLANPWLGVLPNISCLFHRPLGLIYDRIMKSNGEEGKWEEEEKSTVWLQNKFSMSASSLISHLLRSFVCAGAVAVPNAFSHSGLHSTCVVLLLFSCHWRRSSSALFAQQRKCSAELL